MTKLEKRMLRRKKRVMKRCSHGSRMREAALALVVCAVLSGCTAVEIQPTETAVNYGVSINVPYATSTPRPSDAPATDVPLSISANGDVQLNDASFLDVVAAEDDEETDGVYNRLESGDTGEEVAKLQTRLKQLNYYTGEITGIFDSATETAVRLFEVTYGVMQTGVATPAMQNKLYAAGAPVYGSDAYNEAVASRYTTLQRGDAGGGVRSLQERLQELGYPMMEITGTYDEETAYAVSLFYQAYDFEANDVATVAMQKELYSDGARRYKLADGDNMMDIYTISVGSMGSMVIRLQTRLIQLGYLTTPVSGNFDETTAEAVRKFQAALGLEQTGAANLELQQVIASDAAPTQRELETIPETAGYVNLQEGDNGLAVRSLQQRLVDLGYASGTPNGKYERITIRVVNMFRGKLGMTETGAASAEMQAILFSDFAPRYDEEITPKVTVDPNTLTKQDSSGQSGEIAMLYRALSMGNQGQDVLALETRLQQLGYFEGTPDGVYDDETGEAVGNFRKAMGLSKTTDASINLQYQLYSKAAPENGVSLWKEEQNFRELFLNDMNDGVLNLQKQLWTLGYLDRDSIEGAYGLMNEATLAAVQDVQRAMGYAGVTQSASEELQAFLLSEYSEKIRRS
ncbi:MAG: peptidoglycan-binding protein [Eubacteriales bacterium]|nr:peptidoglycan-binding protein [Eubacteriales bacterium]